ncbi:MAG: class I SAM-dependent methyltransferase [Nitriliruptorales bacterium]|nr:class I SAM-dependent methyltransferase [Nitriliruptorales bacterium]
MNRSAASPRPELPAYGSEGKDRQLVQAMFDRVAPRYDLANAILSMGQDAHWRRVTAQAAKPAGGGILDVAAGPGNVALELLRRGAREVVAVDLSFNMLAAGADRWGRDGRLGLHWVNADAMSLPFPDDSFDAVTISFGLRNLPDPVAGIAEFARVTRPGGRLVVCEFARPTWGPFRTIYERYLVGLLPRIATVVSSDPTAYVYLARSIQAWPDRRVVASWFEAAGYEGVAVKDLSGGIVALHRGHLRHR